MLAAFFYITAAICFLGARNERQDKMRAGVFTAIGVFLLFFALAATFGKPPV